MSVAAATVQISERTEERQLAAPAKAASRARADRAPAPLPGCPRLRRDRGGVAACAGDGLAASEGDEGGGLDPGRDRRAAHRLLRRPRAARRPPSARGRAPA